MPNHHHHHHYPSRRLANRAATKLLHLCLPPVSLWIVHQLWFMFFISASTVLHQVVFSRQRVRFPSGFQWIAVLVMELASLRSMCPKQRYRFMAMMVSISSCWHRARRSRLEMVLCQKMRWIFLRLVMWKDCILAMSCWSFASTPIRNRRGDNTQLWFSFSLVLMLYYDELQTAFRLLKAFLTLLCLLWMLSLVPSSYLKTLPR